MKHYIPKQKIVLKRKKRLNKKFKRFLNFIENLDISKLQMEL